jgi:hypothetical protein
MGCGEDRVKARVAALTHVRLPEIALLSSAFSTASRKKVNEISTRLAGRRDIAALPRAPPIRPAVADVK